MAGADTYAQKGTADHKRGQMRDRVAQLEAQLAKHEEAEQGLALLESFPEENPNMVIETDLEGSTTYLNPVAERHFPELWDLGFDHPLLQDLTAIVEVLHGARREFMACEIQVGEKAYEQKICYTTANELVRIRI